MLLLKLINIYYLGIKDTNMAHEYKNIVGATMAFREGDLIRYTLDNLLLHCLKVVVLLDNNDEYTEGVILEYKELYPDIFDVIYSSVPTFGVDDLKPGTMKARLNSRQGEIREQVLKRLRELNKEQKIDILLWPDGDEMFTDDFINSLDKFIESDKKVMMIRPITIFDNFETIRCRTLVPHGRVYKYIPELTALPYRGRTLYLPYTREDAYRDVHTMIHLPYLTSDSREFRKVYTGKNTAESTANNLQIVGEDVRRISAKRFIEITSKADIITVKDYERLFKR